MVNAEAFTTAGKRWLNFEEHTGPALANIVDLAKKLTQSEHLDDNRKLNDVGYACTQKIYITG